MRSQTFQPRPRRGLSYKKDANITLLAKKVGSNTQLEVKHESIKQLGYTSNHSYDVKLEIDHLIALLLNTFIWSSWYKNLELSSRDELSLEINKTIDGIVNDIMGRCKIIGSNWVLIISRDLLNVVVQWINTDQRTHELPFQLQIDSNRLINREQAYSRIMLGKIVDRSMGKECKSRIQRDFIVGVLDGVIMKSVIEGYSDNFAIWGIIDKVTKKMLTKGDDSNNNGKLSVSELINFKSKYKPLEYTDLVPMLKLISHITEMYEYPILWIMMTMFIQMILALPILNRIVTNIAYGLIKRFVNEKSISEVIQSLNKVLYPLKDSPTKWGLKPRWEPSNDEELEELRIRCVSQVAEVILNVQNTRFGWVFFDRNVPSNTIANVFVNKFQFKELNKVLIWNLIENITSHVR